MKKCPNCQMEYEDSQKFCSQCGTPLTEPAELPGAPEQELPSPLVGEPAAAPEPAEELIAPAEPAEAEQIAPEPVKEPVKEPEKPVKEKKKVGAGRRILSVLLCVLLFFFLLFPTLGYAVRRATTEPGLKVVLEDVDLADVKVAPFFEDVDDEELTLSEMISEDLGKNGLKIGESSVAKVVNSSAMKNYLAGELAQVCEDVYRGRTSHEFDPDTLREELLNGKTARVLEKEKINLTAKEADTITQLLTDYGLIDFLSRDTLKSEAPGLVRLMNLGFSYVTIIVLLVLAAAIVLLIFKVNRWSIGLWFGDIGGTAFAAGLVLSLATLVARAFPGLWARLCGAEALAAAVSGGVLAYSLRYSLIVLGVGLVLAVLGRLIRGGKKKKEQ